LVKWGEDDEGEGVKQLSSREKGYSTRRNWCTADLTGKSPQLIRESLPAIAT